MRRKICEWDGGKKVEIIELSAYAGTDVRGADGNRNVMLTSAIKVMHRDVERTLNAISVGFFGGGNVTLQADTGSTGYVSTEGRNQLSAGTIEKLDAAYESLIKAIKQVQGYGQLKEENALEWTGRLNNIRACAGQIVSEEIIFAWAGKVTECKSSVAFLFEEFRLMFLFARRSFDMIEYE